MKKITAIFISIVFIIAFLFIGFFGDEIKVGEPTVYANKIVWNTEDFNGAKNVTIEFKDGINHATEDPNDLQYDATFRYKTNDLSKPYKINIKCHVDPANANNKLLQYYMPESAEVSYKVLNDNTCDVAFKSGGIYTLYINALGGKNIRYYIKFIIKDNSEFM